MPNPRDFLEKCEVNRTSICPNDTRKAYRFFIRSTEARADRKNHTVKLEESFPAFSRILLGTLEQSIFEVDYPWLRPIEKASIYFHCVDIFFASTLPLYFACGQDWPKIDDRDLAGSYRGQLNQLGALRGESLERWLKEVVYDKLGEYGELLISLNEEIYGGLTPGLVLIIKLAVLALYGQVKPNPCHNERKDILRELGD